MTNKMYGAFIASLGAIALMLAANETFARSGATPHGAFASTRPILHPSTALRHHRRHGRAPWLAIGDGFYGPSNGELMGDVAQPTSGDVHTTYTYDVPWDWAHRYPPAVAPSDRPYVSSCPTETVTVPGHGGEEQTVTIMRCY